MTMQAIPEAPGKTKPCGCDSHAVAMVEGVSVSGHTETCGQRARRPTQLVFRLGATMALGSLSEYVALMAVATAEGSYVERVVKTWDAAYPVRVAWGTPDRFGSVNVQAQVLFGDHDEVAVFRMERVRDAE